jgi:hypothetical protein
MNEGESVFRDYLKGYDESNFRSTRFSVWFNTPEEYFSEQLKIYRVRFYEFDVYQSVQPSEDAMSVHQAYQEKYAPVGSIDAGAGSSLPIKVYSDYVQVVENLSDKARF